MPRRAFLQKSLAAAGALAAGSSLMGQENRPPLHLATNEYPWTTFYQRENRNLRASLDAAFGEMAAAGLSGFEPIINQPGEIDQMAPLLRKHKLEMRSLYVNSTLHDRAQIDQSIDHVTAIARKAKSAGTRIIVTNPSPIRWGGPQDKNDEQLRAQAAALNALGEKLAALGLILAYHNHDAELRNAAREFHHMMLGTDPKYVTLCLDAHWIYRGSGNSAVAVFDVLKLYAPRITELHLRQSVNGTWTESFGQGDIDYAALAQHLLDADIKPHLVLEQAVEGKTPRTLDAQAAHRRGAGEARRVFASFAQ